MRTVLMALVVLWCCLLAIILPVILGQQVQNYWDRKKVDQADWNKEENQQDHSEIARTRVDGLIGSNPSSVLRHADANRPLDKTVASNQLNTRLLDWDDSALTAGQTRQRSQGRDAETKDRKDNQASWDVDPLWSDNDDGQSETDEGQHDPHDSVGERKEHLVLSVSAPDLFQTITLVLDQVSELLSPGFVIQRVQGNVSWLEEVQDRGMDCYFSGIVMQHPNNSNVALSLCDGVRGIIQMNGERYYIRPETLRGSHNMFSEASKSSSSFLSILSPYLKQYQHIVSRIAIKNPHSPSNCSITANFKHHRLKKHQDKLEAYKQLYHSSQYEHLKDVSFGEATGSLKENRRRRSVGVSRRHTVETLVVADAKMYEYHGKDVENYVLTLMSIVKTIYQSPSIGNFINVVVVKLIIYEKSSETPFKVNQSAAGTLKNFCQWQHKNKESSKESHYDTAILITRENICRAPGKCDTLGLAELGTICDKLRSCSLIEDNGISAAFTIAHELGHVFNLPHDDDKQCTESLPENQKVAFHVMAPTLDYNASPWDWSSCSAKLMTDFLESGLASCLLDGPRVKTWMSTMQSLNQPGWNYSVNKQCKFVFGEEFALCPYSNNPVCRRLWCTNSSDSKIGCRTKHMPWADGTPCGDNKVCQHGDCLVVTEPKPKAVNGGWGHWKQYGPCSRTCGGGVKSKIRECDNPVPKNGGTYCLGARVRYKSCFVKECPSPSRDFRAMQCDSEEMRRKNRVKELPNNSTWNPKTSGVHLKDVCKLYCGAGNSSIYSLFAKKVIDGTKCGPYTEDICVNGQCWAVGCDNKLGSKMKRDMCGVCGGDNFTCRSVTGIFNNAIYGYNLVGTIPQGATHIDIRQYGQMRHTKDDDNYLALKDSQQRYILNGEYSVRTEPWKIKLGGAIIEYSGSEEFVERINTTMIIGEDITLYVLSVGKLNPPNITYSYLVSVTKKVVWKNLGWSKCNSVCNGERKSLIKCVREEDTHKVQPKRCSNLERPKAISERCNTDCTISWRVFKNEECPVRCGKGMRRQLVHCVKVTDYKNVVIIHDKECIKLYGAKPDEHVPCDGSCLPTYWTYTEWSQCSSSCGDGLQHRQAKCVDDTAKELPDKECAGKDKELTRHCSNPQCAEWTTTQWTGCSVTCGYGYKQRKVLCVQGNQKVEDGLCSKKKPVNKKECTLKECPEWTAGGWGPCSVTCGKGVNMRAVKCRTGNFSQEDDVCDASRKVNDRQPCFLGPCPTEAPTSTTTIKSVSKGGFWRAGAWTECSSLCDSGTKYRVVSCTAYNGTVLDESECSHLQRPASKENCFLRPCGHWHQGDWSDCSVTCGSGVQIRYVSCTFNKQRQDERFCDVSVKPETEIQCNRGTCLSHEDLSIAVITSNKVVGTSHWRIGPWSSCSSTCGSGWERRLVVCSDEKGPSKNCDITLRPDEFKACDSGACPSWKTDVWSNCSASDCDSEGIQKRLVVCQLPNNDILANSNCDPKKKPPELQNCKAQCQRPEGTWKEGSWSGCSVTCGQGMRVRNLTCQDSKNTVIDQIYCKDKKPRNTKPCFRRACPTWHVGKWSQCSASCGAGEKTRRVHCMDKRKKFVDDKYCEYQPKPMMQTPCEQEDCNSYTWQVEPWSECSTTCGFGSKKRSLYCQDPKGTRVSTHLCDDATKPKDKRRCSEFPCPYMWIDGPWSECSKTCGMGTQTRQVSCQAVTKEYWILPGEAHYKCRASEKPISHRYCSTGNCAADAHWEYGPWGECSAKCGKGIQTRPIYCVDMNGEKVNNSECISYFKPGTNRPCYGGHCYATSCKELKNMTTIRVDGDYHLKVGNQLVKIYCHEMRKKHPKEYISLIQGADENYAEMFEKKLKVPTFCPYDGMRPDEDCLECRKKTFEHAGNSSFFKIRINLETLTVITTDTTFGKTHFGNSVPYATGGDCYSSSNCPQGRFSINLVDTGFTVSTNTTWTLQGNRASQRIWRLRDGQIIRGVCGGYCGVCSPDPKNGLKLDLLR